MTGDGRPAGRRSHTFRRIPLKEGAVSPPRGWGGCGPICERRRGGMGAGRPHSSQSRKRVWRRSKEKRKAKRGGRHSRRRLCHKHQRGKTMQPGSAKRRGRLWHTFGRIPGKKLPWVRRKAWRLCDDGDSLGRARLGPTVSCSMGMLQGPSTKTGRDRNPCLSPYQVENTGGCQMKKTGG